MDAVINHMTGSGVSAGTSSTCGVISTLELGISQQSHTLDGILMMENVKLEIGEFKSYNVAYQVLNKN